MKRAQERREDLAFGIAAIVALLAAFGSGVLVMRAMCCACG